MRAESFENLQQTGIDNQKPVLRVVHNVGDFFRMQPQIQGMQNRSHCRHTKIRFEMLLLIPHQRGHPVPARNARIQQGRG